MAHFLNRGNRWHPHATADLQPHSVLPANNYVVKVDEFKQFFLDTVPSFSVPSKLYGPIAADTQRIIRTFQDREQSTGVLLAGEKGSGKTLLVKNIAVELAKIGVPTVIINHPWHGDQFNTFIQLIEQPCVVLFDEFEKVYEVPQQSHLLTLLDGVFPTKKLFLLTCNDEYRINSHMRNRPGRIYYYLKFEGLDRKFIQEYCEENLKNTAHIDKLCAIAGMFEAFNFDMLKAIVEEMNRYDEDPQTVLRLVNASPASCSGGEYEIKIKHQGREYCGKQLNDAVFSGNPFISSIEVAFYTDGSDYETDEPSCPRKYIEFTTRDFTRYESSTNTFVYRQHDYELVLTKINRAKMNMYAF